jgi:hypothetical protein
VVGSGYHVDLLMDIGDVTHDLDAAVVFTEHIHVQVLGFKSSFQIGEGQDQAASGKDHQRRTFNWYGGWLGSQRRSRHRIG